MTVRLIKKSKWRSDGYDIRPSEGEGIVSDGIYGFYARGINELELKGIRMEIDESMKDTAKGLQFFENTVIKDGAGWGEKAE